MKHLKEVLEIKRSPESIASGFALGTFLAVLPTFGIGAFIGLLLLLIFKKVSKISMLIAFGVWNPVVMVPVYGIGYLVGDFLLEGIPVRTFRFEILNNVYVFSRQLFFGNTILAVVFGAVSYFVVLKLAKAREIRNFLR